MDEQIEKIIKDVLELDLEVELNGTMKPNSIPEWDSFGQVAIISELESRFKISFNFNDILKLDSIENIKAIVKKKVEKNV